MTTASDHLPTSSIEVTDGLPPELASETPIWEVVNASGHHREASARRLYADGTVYGFGSTRRVRGDAGLPRRVPAPAAWRLDARIEAAAVTEISELIANTFAELPHNPLGASESRYPLTTWRAYPAGAEHAVVTPSTARPAELPDVIRTIQTTIQRNTIAEGVPLDQPR